MSLSIGRHETLGLVGESGSGKTTFARCLIRLVEPDGGEIALDGIDVAGRRPANDLRNVRTPRPDGVPGPLHVAEPVAHGRAGRR